MTELVKLILSYQNKKLPQKIVLHNSEPITIYTK